MNEYYNWYYFHEGRQHLLLKYNSSSSLSSLSSSSSFIYSNYLLKIKKLLPSSSSSSFSSSSSSSSSSNIINTQEFEVNYNNNLLFSYINKKYLILNIIKYKLNKDFYNFILIHLDNNKNNSHNNSDNNSDNNSHNNNKYKKRPSYRNEIININEEYGDLLPNLQYITKLIQNIENEDYNNNSHKNNSHNNNSFLNLSFEFKVKCGLLSINPFLDRFSIKRKISKFKYMQYSKMNKAHKKNKQFHLSSYNPCYLSSQIQSKVNSTLYTLENNPQNNFVVSFNGNQIFGLDQTDIQLFSNTCNLFFQQQRQQQDSLNQSLQSTSNSKDKIYHILTTILSYETAIVELETIQALDLLDIEGMIIVYDRYLELLTQQLNHENNHDNHNENYTLKNEELQEKAIQLITNHLLDPIPTEICLPIANHRRNLNYNLIESQNTHEVWNEALHSFQSLKDDNQSKNLNYSQNVLWRLYEISLQISERISYVNSQELLSSKELESSILTVQSNLCNNFLQNINIDECIFLLKIWLFSLSASDASVILTISSIPSNLTSQILPSHIVNPQTLFQQHHDNYSCQILQDQNESYCGLAEFYETNIFEQYDMNMKTNNHIEISEEKLEDKKTEEIKRDNNNNNNNNNNNSYKSKRKELFAYQMSIIDIGTKSVDKIIEKRKNNEILIQDVYEELEKLHYLMK